MCTCHEQITDCLSKADHVQCHSYCIGQGEDYTYGSTCRGLGMRKRYVNNQPLGVKFHYLQGSIATVQCISVGFTNYFKARLKVCMHTASHNSNLAHAMRITAAARESYNTQKLLCRRDCIFQGAWPWLAGKSEERNCAPRTRDEHDQLT